MYIKHKKIGIWGSGIVGTSALKFFAQHTPHLSIMDCKQPTSQQQELFSHYHCSFVDQTHAQEFLNYNDFVLASPGIDVRPYGSYTHKFITELDLFAAYFKKPIIAVTGSMGKTSVTTLLAHLMRKKKQIAVGGNIGTPMFDLIPSQEQVSYALLEVSSFQLELIRSFAPSLAILTSFVPNHLDRHTTEHNYFLAKYNIINFQHGGQQALVPLSLASDIIVRNPTSTLSFFSTMVPTPQELLRYRSYQIFYCDHEFIVHYKDTIHTPLFPIAQLPAFNFLSNWLIIAAALKLLKLPLSLLAHVDADATTLATLEHRLEFCGTKNGIDFYNDSKSTVMESTLAALKALDPKPIILLLGGLSKGINRKPYFAKIPPIIKSIICFGKEAEALASYAQEYGFDCSHTSSLEDAFQKAVEKAAPGDQILLSPGGSSYDLFVNYVERGKYFKALLKALG